MVLISLCALVLSAYPSMTAAEEGTKDVNIERYLEFRMEFDSGDRLHLEATVEASPYPVTIFLVKGEEAYADWIESEDVDVQKILDGKNVSDMNVTFQVIENFSEKNVTSFQRSIDIGDKDTYFLVIALYRDSSMSTEEVMSRASQVQYDIDWKIENKDFPWEIMALAAVIFLTGSAFIIAYFVGRRRYLSRMDQQEANGPGKIGAPPDDIDIRERRRAPPMIR